MRFRLVYDGELKAAGNNKSRAPEKLALRNKFHPQIASLTATHPAMTGIGFVARTSRLPPIMNRPSTVSVDIAGNQVQVRNAILSPIELGSYQFVPLVRRSLDLACELDILFLRNHAPGSVVKSGGDLDNRIKTLFDGLRIPTADEARIGKPVANPCFCLLEDDSLITTFAVRTDRLLTDPTRSEHGALLVIEVKLTVLKLNSHNVGFLTD